MKLYLGRSSWNDYELFKIKRGGVFFNGDSGFSSEDCIFFKFCKLEWHQLTGNKLKIGQVKEVKLIQLKNGFKFELGKDVKL